YIQYNIYGGSYARSNQRKPGKSFCDQVLTAGAPQKYEYSGANVYREYFVATVEFIAVKDAVYKRRGEGHDQCDAQAYKGHQLVQILQAVLIAEGVACACIHNGRKEGAHGRYGDKIPAFAQVYDGRVDP